MGAKNIKLAHANWGHLRDGPFRLLSYMSLIALDADLEPKFWAGRESLAIGLGRLSRLTSSDRTADEQQREREAAYLAVKRALRALKSAGAITPLNVPGPGQQAIYRLNLASPAEPTERPSIGETR